MLIKKLVHARVALLHVTEPRMHTVHCKNCPSAPGQVLDLETKDILAYYPREEQLKTAFACGWNGKRYCKGYCDLLSITNNDLIKITEERARE